MELSWTFNLFGASIMFMVLDARKIKSREAEMAAMRERVEDRLRSRASVTPPVTAVTQASRRVTRKPKADRRVCPYCDDHPPLKDGQFACSAKCRQRRHREEAKKKTRR
jgi:hypothetical protein